MITDDYFKDINWPSFIAMPKPGQSMNDDDCLWTLLDNATVRQMTIFLLNEPSFVDHNTQGKLCQLANLARTKGKPDDNFLEAIGVQPEKLEEIKRLRATRIREKEEQRRQRGY